MFRLPIRRVHFAWRGQRRSLVTITKPILSARDCVNFVQHETNRISLPLVEKLEIEIAAWNNHLARKPSDQHQIQDQIEMLTMKTRYIKKHALLPLKSFNVNEVKLASILHINEALLHTNVGDRIRQRRWILPFHFSTNYVTSPLTVDDFWTLHPNLWVEMPSRAPLPSVLIHKQVLAKHPVLKCFGSAVVTHHASGNHYLVEFTELPHEYFCVHADDLLQPEAGEVIKLSAGITTLPTPGQRYAVSTTSSLAKCNRRYLPYQFDLCTPDETWELCKWALWKQ